MFSKDELIDKRRDHIYDKLKDAPRHLFRKKLIDVANELYLSPRTIYRDYEAKSKHR